MAKKTLILFDKDTPPEDALRAIRQAAERLKQESAGEEKPKARDRVPEPPEGKDSTE